MCIRTSLGLLAITAGIVACSDVTAPSRSISPTAQSSHGTSFDCSDPDTFCNDGRSLPPPPSLDTVGYLSDASGAFLTGAPAVRVQYFMNKTDNNGWITFKGQASTSVLSSADARISIHKGSVSGKGTLSLVMPGSAVLSFDLSNAVSSKSTFNGDCAKGCASLIVAGTLTPKVGKPSTFTGQLQIAPPAGDVILTSGK